MEVRSHMAVKVVMVVGLPAQGNSNKSEIFLCRVVRRKGLTQAPLSVDGPIVSVQVSEVTQAPAAAGRVAAVLTWGARAGKGEDGEPQLSFPWGGTLIGLRTQGLCVLSFLAH